MTGARVRLIAPSGYPHDPEAARRGVARLRAAGCTVDGLAVLERREQRFAGSDEARLADFQTLAAAPDLPDIALAVRGGYGATRLLERLPYDALRERLQGGATLLVGHSDFTAVALALCARAGLATFSGPMLGADFGAETPDPFTWRQFWATACAPNAGLSWDAPAAAPVEVAGTLWGGNLAMLASLVGTPYCPAVEGGILFVEDVGEPPYRIERMLYQLKLAGILERQQAILLGHFSRCFGGPYDGGYDVSAVVARLRAMTRAAVVEGVPVGHVAAKATLPVGVRAELRVEGGTARLAWSGHPHLPASLHPGDAIPDPGAA